MNTTTLLWVACPFVAGFFIYLLPRFDRPLALAGAWASIAYAALVFIHQAPINLRLVDNFGISLSVDTLAAFFILTNGLVTTAVLIYCWSSQRTAFFYAQVLILHGSVNAAFVCTDFVSLYVALEVLSIATFLVIAYPRSDRSIWVALRYLFTSNIAMLFYLVGAALVYKTHHSFDFAGLSTAPPEATSLIFLGLVVKGGIFISGLWLPLTHSESESPTSALMSGIVVKASVLPLLRCAVILPDIDPIVRIFGVGTALLGALYAICEKDTKRLLAFSTVSQLGFILAAPEVGGFYALTHGLVKSALFLITGQFASRSLDQLHQQPIARNLWIALLIASFSISGFPLLSGFGAKILTLENIFNWQEVGMNLAAVGTAIAYAKFIFLPHSPSDPAARPQRNFWIAMAILLGGLFVANVVYYQAYTLENIAKPLGITAIGWLAYYLIFRRATFKLPTIFEQFEHLLGWMGLTLILIFWMAVA